MERKRILVTGAGSGFGREVALRLAAHGHDVTAGVQITPQITELAREAAARGVELRVEKLDVTSARDRAYAAQREVDVLFNNAGDAEAGAISEIPVEIVRDLFDTNVFGPLALTQDIVRGMVGRRRGKIVFVSSIAGLITGPYTGAYCASKHALEAVAEAMHHELAVAGIQVSVINPGPYRTGFNDRMMETPRRWYDPRRHATAPDSLRFPFDQFDPEEMIARMVEVAERDDGLFRNLLPAGMASFVREDQAAAWTRRQNGAR
ncbi:SDR family oxidoreductase [Burkholderia alba]|uniref:SDR family oxidoreductase n=1 Tax=Burkholderia alba TaxID=2683677 RepID=UPI002B056540|nr:SDR family oxidoreductase [Burkholderia alba]